MTLGRDVTGHVQRQRGLSRWWTRVLEGPTGRTGTWSGTESRFSVCKHWTRRDGYWGDLTVCRCWSWTYLNWFWLPVETRAQDSPFHVDSFSTLCVYDSCLLGGCTRRKARNVLVVKWRGFLSILLFMFLVTTLSTVYEHFRTLPYLLSLKIFLFSVLLLTPAGLGRYT